jgi:heterodisulfide reductase subunit A-like polyferredoxin
MCSEAGQNLVKDAIKEYGLTGVVICSCSPRMHEATFRKAAASAGLNPYMVELPTSVSSVPGFIRIRRQARKKPLF